MLKIVYRHCQYFLYMDYIHNAIVYNHNNKRNNNIKIEQLGSNDMHVSP